jgi:hypothetical protein
MQSMPRQSVIAAGGVMILAALVGVYMGLSHSLTAPGGAAEEAGAIVPSVTPVASAKPILTPAVTMDEAEVRRLAREEAKALITPKPVAHKAPSDDADDQDADAPQDQLAPINPTVPLAPARPATPVPQG